MQTEAAIRNKQTTRSFFKALEWEDVDTLLSLFSESARHVNPYQSDLFPKGAEGKEGIRTYWPMCS